MSLPGLLYEHCLSESSAAAVWLSILEGDFLYVHAALQTFVVYVHENFATEKKLKRPLAKKFVRVKKNPGQRNRKGPAQLIRFVGQWQEIIYLV